MQNEWKWRRSKAWCPRNLKETKPCCKCTWINLAVNFCKATIPESKHTRKIELHLNACFGLLRVNSSLGKSSNVAFADWLRVAFEQGLDVDWIMQHYSPIEVTMISWFNWIESYCLIANDITTCDNFNWNCKSNNLLNHMECPNIIKKYL